MYAPCYNLGYNALTYTYMVEIWPYADRSRGIAFFQLFGRLAAFFTTFVNPIGMDSISWRYLITYCKSLEFPALQRDSNSPPRLLACVRDRLRLLLLPRDCEPHARGACLP